MVWCSIFEVLNSIRLNLELTDERGEQRDRGGEHGRHGGRARHDCRRRTARPAPPNAALRSVDASPCATTLACYETTADELAVAFVSH